MPDAGALYRIAWSADGTQLAVATQRRGLQLWQAGVSTSLGKDDSALVEVALSPDGQTLASADKDGRLRLWDMATRQPLHEPLLRHAGPVLALAWAPDGRRLASAGWDRGVVLSRTAPPEWAELACRLVRRNPPAGTDEAADACPPPPAAKQP